MSLLKGWLLKSPLITSGGHGTKSIPTESDTPTRLKASTPWPTRAPIESALEWLWRSCRCFKSSKNFAKTLNFSFPITGCPFFFSEFGVKGLVELALYVGFVGGVYGSDFEVPGAISRVFRRWWIGNSVKSGFLAAFRLLQSFFSPLPFLPFLKEGLLHYIAHSGTS